MNQFIKSIILSILAILPTICLGSIKKREHQVKIEIVVEDTALLKNFEIQFDMSKNSINSEYLAHTELQTFKINTVKTIISLPLSTPLNYGRISLTIDNKKAGPFNPTNNVLLFEAGDDLKLLLEGKKAVFLGKGSARLNYLLEANQKSTGIIPASTQTKSLYQAEKYNEVLKSQKLQIDSLFTYFASKLRSISHQMSKTSYQQIEADNWARKNRMILTLISGRSATKTKIDSNYTLAYTKFISSFFSDFKMENFDDELLANSYQYGDLLYKIMYTKLNEVNNSPLPTKKEYSLIDQYQSIIKEFSGDLRDKLLLITFNRNFRKMPESNTLIQDALNVMTPGKYRQAMQEFEKSQLGSAYPFALPDASGKIHRLDDFKGKLIIMDFWFTGCIPCKLLAETMKPIISKYSKNPNIVFITVSIDGIQNRANWLESLERETYTSEEEVNLLATDGDRSAIIRHYNIQAYPTIFFISKDGMMISTAPPRPQKGNLESIKEFEKLIDEHL